MWVPDMQLSTTMVIHSLLFSKTPCSKRQGPFISSTTVLLLGACWLAAPGVHTA